eukprot:XP_001707776.1 Hypothetical protein GL50803_38555 [Giardia lamblia ATCC 50803]
MCRLGQFCMDDVHGPPRRSELVEVAAHHWPDLCPC